MKKQLQLLLAALALALSGQVAAADKIKIGFISTMSGPSGAWGTEIRDGFNLALKANAGKVGGLPAEVTYGDDTGNPDTAKQLADKMMKRDKVDLITGIIFGHVALAVAPAAIRNETFYVSTYPGPHEFAGEKCSPYYFTVGFQSDAHHEAMGKYMSDKGYKRVYVIVPNFPAGKDAVNGFKRFYKGELAGEVYTKVNQPDYSAEIAQLRASKPDAVYIFLPGAMGINFAKQYDQAGLSAELPLSGPGSSFDEDVLRAVGETVVGAANSSQWNHDLDNPQNLKFVADFEKEYGRRPSLFSALAYDAVFYLDAAVRDSGGKIEDKKAFQKALAAANFKSVRGNFRLGANHHTIQNYYLRQVVKDQKGGVTNKIVGTILSDHSDAYAAQCRMDL